MKSYDESPEKLPTRVRSWLKLLLLLLDDLLIIGLAVFILWTVGVDFEPWIIGLIVAVFVVLLLVMHRLLMPSLANRGSGDPAGVIGELGNAVTTLDREGLVRVRGEVWKAETRSSTVESGEPIRVVESHRLKLIVEPTGRDSG